MASNKTQHYNLNQWEATDLVQRTEFNADNAKLDSALHALEVGKAEGTALTALSNTVAQNAKKESADVAALNQTHAADVAALRNENCWIKLNETTLGSATAQFDLPIPDAGQYQALLCQFCTGGPYKLDLKLNGGAAFYPAYGESTTDTVTLVSRSFQTAVGDIQLFRGGSSAGFMGRTETIAFNGTGTSSGSGDMFSPNMSFSDLRSLNFVGVSGQMNAGSRFVLYGLKK